MGHLVAVGARGGLPECPVQEQSETPPWEEQSPAEMSAQSLLCRCIDSFYIFRTAKEGACELFCMGKCSQMA